MQCVYRDLAIHFWLYVEFRRRLFGLRHFGFVDSSRDGTDGNDFTSIKHINDEIIYTRSMNHWSRELWNTLSIARSALQFAAFFCLQTFWEVVYGLIRALSHVFPIDAQKTRRLHQWRVTLYRRGRAWLIFCEFHRKKSLRGCLVPFSKIWY